jgi:hypothetical protein
MKPDGMIRCYYDFDLGPFGPIVLNSLCKAGSSGPETAILVQARAAGSRVSSPF